MHDKTKKMMNKKLQGKTLCFSLLFILQLSAFAQQYLKIDSIALPSGTNVNCLLYKGGTIYAGSDNGLFVVNGKNLHVDWDLKDFHVNVMRFGESLWLGTYENAVLEYFGHDSYKVHKFFYEPKNHLVTSMYSKTFTQYLGTGLGSIFIREKDNSYTEVHSPLKSNIYSIAVDKKNDILIGTTNGLYLSKDEKDWKLVSKKLNTVYQMEQVGNELVIIGLNENDESVFGSLSQKKYELDKMYVSLSDISAYPKFLEFSYTDSNMFWICLNSTVVRYSSGSNGPNQLNIQQSNYPNFVFSDVEHIAAVNDTVCWISTGDRHALYRLTLLKNDPFKSTSTDIVVDGQLINKGINSEIAILFKSESWKLDNTPRNHKIIRDLANTLVRFPELTLKIEGHTGYFDDKQKASDVSLKRAEAIKEAIIEHSGNIKANRITTEGFGNTQPKNAERLNAPENKRVEVRFE